MPFSDSEPKVPLGEVGFVQGFFGGVAADEPRAVLAGRDVLTAGGTAADAATAIYFTLAVTMPSAAGLGGGGICLVRDPNTQTVQTLDFLGQPSSGPGRRMMVPGNPRGIFALHAKFGRFQWREIVRPAENLARFGSQISRAFAEELQRSEGMLMQSPGARKLFAAENGEIVREGASIEQTDLAATLSLIRARGGGVLYNGAYAREFAKDVQRMGYGLTYRDLNAARPIWRSTLRVPFVVQTSIHFPMPRTPAGTLGAKVAAMLAENGRYKDATPVERTHMFAEAIQRAAADGANGYHEVTIERSLKRGTSKIVPRKLTYTEIGEDYAERLMQGYNETRLTELSAPASAPAVDRGGVGGVDGGTTSFTVVDVSGGAVACALTMNGAFGTGEAVPGAGYLLAKYPESPVKRDLSLGALMTELSFGNKLYMVGAASGGMASQAVLTQVAFSVALNAESDVEREVAAKNRVFRDLSSRITYVERGMPANIAGGLKRRGHQLIEVPQLSRVNMTFCDNGLPAKVTSCKISSDPRGFGYATVPG